MYGRGRGGDVLVRCTGYMADVDGKSYGNESAFVSIIPPVVAVAFFRGVLQSKMRCGI